jgi:hypothetical protein
MKTKVFLVAIALGLGSLSFAQDEEVLTGKDGTAVLPAAGDWALGFDAAPLLNYAGNMFNGNTNNSMGAAWANSDMAITGKYFKDANTAYVASVRIGMGSATMSTLTDTSGTGDYISDDMTMGSNAVVLGGGMEMRRGYGRLQGKYGFGGNISMGGASSSYTYALACDANNPFARVTESNSGSTFSLSVGAMIGVEYFIMPKVSIGAEYTWGLGFSSTGEGTTTSEYFDGTEVVTMDSRTGGSSGFGIDTGNNGGAIMLMFHF